MPWKQPLCMLFSMIQTFLKSEANLWNPHIQKLIFIVGMKNNMVQFIEFQNNSSEDNENSFFSQARYTEKCQ